MKFPNRRMAKFVINITIASAKGVNMTEKLEMYKCETCGNLVQVLLAGEGELVCCGHAMQHLAPNTTENVKTEYHIPVYKYTDKDGIVIQVGQEPHPMIPEHYIMFIETISEDKKCVRLHYLEPNEEPKMILDKKIGKETALAFCKLHGLWEGQSD